MVKVLTHISLQGVNRIYFSQGTIITFSKNFIASAQLDIPCFDGSIELWRFNECIKLFKSEYLDIEGTSKGLIFRPKKDSKFEFYQDQETESLPQVNLWDSKIEWQICPSDLFEGIHQVGTSAGEEAYEKVYVSGSYVFGFTVQTGCRYKLTSLSPFDMVFEWSQVSKILKKFKDLKLLRAVKLKFPEAEKLKKGMGFDFEDIRIWIPEEGWPWRVEERDTLKNKIDRFESLLLESAKFYIELTEEATDDLYKMSGWMDPDSDMILMRLGGINKGKGNLEISWKNRFCRGSTDIPIRLYGPAVPVSFHVSCADFCGAIKEKCLVGYIGLSENLESRGGIYLKEGRRETMIGIIPDNLKEKEI